MNRSEPRRPIAVASALLLALLVLPAAAFAGGTGTTGLAAVQGTRGTTAQGDDISSNGGLNTYYSYFIEVPPGLSRFDVDLYDADIGEGGGGEAAANRDRARNNFDTTASYTLRDPRGTLRTTIFNTGTAALPTGADAAWLNFFTETPTSGGDAVADNFGATSYANSDGDNAWATNWIETNDDGSPTTGVITINGNRLRIRDNGTGGASTIERQANLSGLAYAAATFSFDYQTQNLDAGDSLAVEVSSNGGATWSTLETFGSTNTTGSRSYDITSSISTNTRIRFREVSGYTGTDSFFVDNLQITDAEVRAGHWELRVDESSAINTGGTGGDDINIFGVRAHDGNSGSGGTELNVYYDSFSSYGTDDPSLTRSYTEYPYLTSGCVADLNDFDWDSNSGATGTATLSNRTGTTTLTVSTMSGNDVWQNSVASGYTTDSASTGYGAWQLSTSITGYVSGGVDNGNYGVIYFGSSSAANPPPTGQPQANTFRDYLPTDAGTRPSKAYLEQLLTYVSGPNPPAVGMTTRFSVTVRVVNPAAQAITFSAANLVTARIPGAGAVYAGSPQVSQGMVTAAPSIGGTGNITWNPGTLAAGATGLLAYRVDVTPTSPGQRVVVTGTPASNGTTARWVDTTGNTTQARATYTFGPICELAATVGVLTYATVTSFDAHAEDGRVVVEWQTHGEAGTAGFDLYRLDPASGKVQRVNPVLLPALAGSPQGGTYRVIDDGAASGAPATYLLAEVEARGGERSYGPYAVLPVEAKPTAPAGDDELLHQTGFSARPWPFDRRPAGDVAQPPTPEVAPLAGDAAALDVAVEANGFYAVPASQIAAGFGVTQDKAERWIRKGRLALANRGHEVAWEAAPDGSALRFYGQKLDSIYSRYNVYRLTTGPGLVVAGAAAETKSPGASGAFADSVHLEKNLFSATVLPLDAESDYWFWDYVASGSPTDGTKSFPFQLEGVAPTTRFAKLTVAFQGATSSGVAGEHHAELALNGTPIGAVQWQGIARQTVTVKLPSSLLREGENTLQVTGVLDSGAPYSIFYLDSFDLTYLRRYASAGGAFFCRGDGNPSVTVTGFPTPDLEVFELGDPLRPKRLEGVAIAMDGGGGYQASFHPGAPDLLYVVVPATGILPPAGISAEAFSDLRSPANGADYLVITAQPLLAAAQELADYRAGTGLVSRVVDLADVYAEWSDGIADPHAVVDFLAYARANWNPAPRYVVLAGAGDFDYKDYLGLGGNLVPPLMTSTPDGIYASDNRFVDLSGNDGVPELAIGRLPVTSPAELSAVVAKIEAFEGAPGAAWTGRALLLADDPDHATSFAADSDQVSALLSPAYATQHIYLGELAIDVARQQLLSGIESGAALVHYIGHGGLDRLAQEGLLTSGDVPGLGNGDRPPVVAAMTCVVNRFALPGFDSLGELLVDRAGGGAVAVWAPSGLSVNAEARPLDEAFLRRAFGGGEAVLGDAVRGALAELAAAGGDRSLLDVYNLLGDPALRIPTPPRAAGAGAGGE